jgi:hypothetical protein
MPGAPHATSPTGRRGPFDSEQAAQMALGNIAACQSVNIDHDKDSTQSNS